MGNLAVITVDRYIATQTPLPSCKRRGLEFISEQILPHILLC